MKKINAFHLKLVAIIAMFINHVGHTFELEFSNPLWDFAYLAIGLLTFPIMAYLLVEGFHYTHNRWRYARRMAIFWILSILPFYYVFQLNWAFIYPFNNIMFTLMMGIFMMVCCEKVKNPIKQGIIAFLFTLATVLSDWSLIGIPIIFAFYKNHGKPNRIKWIISSACFVLLLLSIPNQWTPEALANFFFPVGILATIPLLGNYNGQRGYSPAWVKWGFYAFYPIHLTLLLLLRLSLFGY
jgi:hypothetical protein